MSIVDVILMALSSLIRLDWFEGAPQAIGNPINVDTCRACFGCFEGAPHEYERL